MVPMRIELRQEPFCLIKFRGVQMVDIQSIFTIDYAEVERGFIALKNATFSFGRDLLV